MRQVNFNNRFSTRPTKLYKRVLIFMLLITLEVSTVIRTDARGRIGFGHFGHFGRGFGEHLVFPFHHGLFYPRFGAFYWGLPFGYMRFMFNGLCFYFSEGVYYQYANGRYVTVQAPMGYRVNMLPRGYAQFSIRGLTYFYYYGTFYAPINGQYEVVPAPVGATVDNIPNLSEKVRIDGQTYFIVNGIQFKPVMRNNEIWYQVIKSNG